MKRLMAFLLCVVIAFASISGFALDEEELIVTKNKGDNILFLTNLGILNSTPVDGNAPVTRAELAKMFYRILISKNVPDYSESAVRFNDVAESDMEAVNAVASLGIMGGYGNDVFGSTHNVTYAQAVKSMVSFLGYTVKAESKGGWPAGYWTTALELKLLINAPADMNSIITYNGIADLFRYAAEASVMDTFGNDTHTVAKDITYISRYYNIVRTSAVITANSITDFDGDTLNYGQIKADGVLMTVNETTVSVGDYIGQKVELFCVLNGGKYEVVHYELGENNVTVLNSDDIVSASYSEYVYESETGKEKKVKLAERAIVVYNNSVATSYGLNVINPYSDGRFDGIVKCVDNDGDNRADVIFVEAYETMVVGSVKDGIITPTVRQGDPIDLNDYDDNNVNFMNVAGQAISKDDIEAGDILTYYRDLNNKVTTVYVTVESSSGKIDYIEKQGNVVKKVSIGGIEYECSNGVSRNSDNEKLAPGMFVTVYFDRYGKVSDLEISVFEGELGLIVDHKPDSRGLIDSYIVKIFGADAKFKTFKLADKIKFNEESPIKPEDFLSKFGTEATSGKIKRQVIKYSTNADGELNKVVTANPRLDSDGEYVSDFFIYKDFDGTTAHAYTDVFSCFALRIYPGKSKVFVMPEDNMRDNEKLYKVGYRFSDGTAYKFIAYGDDKNSASPAAILYTTSSDTSTNLNTNRDIFAVERVAHRLNEEGDAVADLVGWYHEDSVGSTIGSIEIADLEDLKTKLGGTLPEAGDILKFSKDVEGKIENASYVFKKSVGKPVGNFAGNPNMAYNSTGNRFVYGDVIYNDGNVITIEIVSDGGVVTRESYPVSRITTGGAVFVKDNVRDNGKFKTTGNNDIYDRHTYSVGCSKALIFTSGKWWVCAVLFND